MSFQDNFNSASRYSPNAQKSKLQQFSPIFTGVLFLLVGVKYLSFSIKALGQGESFYFIVSLVIFASFITSFVLLRKGVALEKLYNASKYSHAPSLPLKTIAGGLLCTVSATSAYLGGYSFIASVTLGLAMFLGWYLYYGFDPREDKIEGYDSTQSAQRIMKLLIQANEDIELIKHSAKSCQSNSIQTAM
ncbi:MAG: hypothetical protein U9N30_00065, partial [Campylobacterota bacterium]|nr:hypothetical protein [Campylobacterota bacterium]